MNHPTPPPETIVMREDPHSALAATLVGELCAELSLRYHRPPSPFTMDEAADPQAGFVVARRNGEPVGCGALRRIDETTVEVKRMYVAPAARRQGIARRILAELERLAMAHNYARIILETGTCQPEALGFYETSGYQRTSSYGRYVSNPEAVCFEKGLHPNSNMCDHKNLQKDKLEKTLQLRNFEIGLFWTRFNYFWLINAAALVGYVSMKDRTQGVLVLVSCFGLVSSFCWTLLNLGSKWWHESWEIKLAKYADTLEERFFEAEDVSKKRILWLIPLRRFSVSAIAIGISFFSFAVWLALATWHTFGYLVPIRFWQFSVDLRFVCLYIASLIFCVVTAFGSLRKRGD